MSATKPRIAVLRSGRTCVWIFAGEKGGAVETEITSGLCPLCYADAVTALPPKLLAEQPDETTHVCHPAFGGCNHGFAKGTS